LVSSTTPRKISTTVVRNDGEKNSNLVRIFVSTIKRKSESKAWLSLAEAGDLCVGEKKEEKVVHNKHHP
jgi:hypothetical protein